MKVPVGPGAAPTLDGWLSFDTVAHNLVWGSNGSTRTAASKTGATVTGDCAKWDATGNLTDSGGACGGISSVSGTGPISATGGSTPAISCGTCVTSTAALTNLTIVAGAGAQASQKTNITTDAGLNNVIVPGSLTTGSGTTNAGYVQFGQGTNVWPGTANTVGWGAPASVTGNYELLLPGTAPAANQSLACSAPVSSVSTCSWSSAGSGSPVIQEHSTAQTQRSTINFRDGHAASDDSTNQATIVDWTPNDARIVAINEEFMSGSNTTGNVGQSGWNFDLLGANNSVGLGASVWPNLGILALKGTTAANNGAALHLGTATTPNDPFGDLVDNVNWDSIWVFRFTNATIRHRVGFANQCNTVTPANGWFLRFDTTLGDASTYKFEVRVSGAPTMVDTGVAVDANFHTLRIRNTGSATIRMSLDGGTEKLICSGCADINVAPPSSSMDACAISSTDASASAVELDLDKFSFSARVKTGTVNTRN